MIYTGSLNICITLLPNISNIVVTLDLSMLLISIILTSYILYINICLYTIVGIQTYSIQYT